MKLNGFCTFILRAFWHLWIVTVIRIPCRCYVYSNGKKATFCIIDKDDVQREKYTTFYKSVIAFGKVEIVHEREETLSAIKELGEKYYPHHDTELQREIEKNINRFLIIRLEIEHITGKQSIELPR